MPGDEHLIWSSQSFSYVYHMGLVLGVETSNPGRLKPGAHAGAMTLRFWYHILCPTVLLPWYLQDLLKLCVIGKLAGPLPLSLPLMGLFPPASVLRLPTTESVFEAQHSTTLSVCLGRQPGGHTGAGCDRPSTGPHLNRGGSSPQPSHCPLPGPLKAASG